MYKLIAIDLDGTLLNSSKQISDENKKTIQYAADKGVKIVVCSGRIFAGAKLFARQIAVREPVIACNGAIVRDMETGDTLFSNSLDVDDCCRAIEMCHQEDIYFHVYMDDTMYTERLEYSSLFYWKKNKELPENERVDIEVVEDAAETVRRSAVPPSKMVVISRDLEQLARARKRVSGIKSVGLMSSSHDNFEVVNHDVNKGTALEFLSKKLEIEPHEIIAMGDNENDYSMLRFAGLSIAMGNATDMIKDIADFVTLTNDRDGVAEAIKKFIL